MMPGDHGRYQNVAEQGAYGHQRYSPPIGRQGPAEQAPGAHYGALDDNPVIVYEGGGVELSELLERDD